MTKDQDKTLRAGQLVVLTQGCYSDFSIDGFYVALQTFKPMDLLAEYMAAHPDQAGDYRFEASQFLAFLLGKGLLLEINYATLHLGDYSRAGEVDFYPLAKGQF